MPIKQDKPAHLTGAVPLHDATELTGDTGLAQIQLADQLYTLRITRAGKLILTK
ncbi:MAG: hemin uptake protein HemP [Pseudomonadota bacterium]